MTRNQNDAETQDSNILSKNEIFETIISSKAFETQNAQQTNKLEREYTSSQNRTKNDVCTKYERLIAKKKKTQQAKKILFLKKQEN
jgi:hypothetical protein